MLTRRTTSNRSPRSIALAAGAAFACCSPSLATVLFWNNAAGGSAGLATNWNPAQIPGATDVLTYNLVDSYTVTFPASVATTSQQVFNFGSVRLIASAPHTDSRFFGVGFAPGSNATVTISSGSFTSDGPMVIGANATGTGVLNVWSSAADVFANDAEGLLIGNTGNGTLNVTSGGAVQLQGSGGITVAAVAGSQGRVLVSGVSSGVPSLLAAAHPVTGDLTLGANGPGTLTVANGGQLTIGDDFTVAPTAGFTSTATIQTATADTSVCSAGDLLIARNTTVAAAGTGTLNVNPGAMVVVGSATAGTTFVGDPDGGTGRLNLTGGLLQTRTLVIDPANGDLVHRGGELRITGSFANSTNLPYLLPDNATTAPAVLRFTGAGTIGTLPGGFQIAAFPLGVGSLFVEAGAVVTTTPGGGGTDRHSVAPDALGRGSITVTGTGSRLNLQASAAVLVGHLGSGALTVANGAILNSFQSIRTAVEPGSSCDVTVSGGAQVMTSGGIHLGGEPSGPGGVCNASVSGSSNLFCSILTLEAASSLVIDDSTITVGPSALVNLVDLRGLVTMSNAAEIAGEAVLVSGTVQGSGNLYGNVTIQPGGTVSAATGDLFIGSASNATSGFVNQGTLNVGGQVVHIQDGNGSPAGDITIAGGFLFAGGLTFAAGDTLTGHGGIAAPITATGATFVADDVTGIVFNAPVNADETNTWGGTKFTFAAGGDFTGRGTIPAAVASEEEASITATGALSMGSNGTNGAIALNGPLHVGPHDVSLRSNTRAILGVVTTINGGRLFGPASNSRNIHSDGFPPLIPPSDRTVFDIVPIELPAASILQGTGLVGGKLVTAIGSTVTATGPLSLVGSEFPEIDIGAFDDGRTFADWAGNLVVGPHAVIFRGPFPSFINLAHRFGPTANVTMAGGSITAPSLLFFGTLSGHGNLIVNGAESGMLTAGITRPGGAAIGTLTVSNTFIMLAGNFLFEGPQIGTLEMDISGDPGFVHDEIVVAQGDATLDGTLTVHILDAEPPPGQVYTILRCDNGGVIGAFDTVNLPALAAGSLSVRYTASTVQVIVRPACLADFNNDGELNPDDLADFIGAFFSQPPGAGSDFNNDGATDPDDLADFIGAFFSGC